MNTDVIRELGQTGQVASLRELEALVTDFENALVQYGVSIQRGSELEAACLSVIEVIGKHQNRGICNPNEDIRRVFTEVLGIWTFLKKIVRLKDHPSFGQFLPHLDLLNKGTVVQNKRLRACEDASNKLFELLFALVLLDVSNDVELADPDLEDTRNPDILATIDGKRWGFACKTIYSSSGKTFFDNLKKGVQQIEVSSAEIGCVMVNLRNLLPHEIYWPIVNQTQHHEGAEPIFAAYLRPGAFVAPRLWELVAQKRNQVVAEIGYDNVMKLFQDKKSLAGFLAFCQTVTGKASIIGPIPTSILALNVGTFADLQAHQVVFEKINSALHERAATET